MYVLVENRWIDSLCRGKMQFYCSRFIKIDVDLIIDELSGGVDFVTHVMVYAIEKIKYGFLEFLHRFGHRQIYKTVFSNTNFYTPSCFLDNLKSTI
jgi:hypothetical protein